MTRRYEETHPWISFTADLGKLDMQVWRLLGMAQSKSEHIAGVPLRPDIAKRLSEVFLSKGAHATTQIEGNTLTEGEVLARVRHELELPPSRQYLGQEIDNVLIGYNLIVEDVLQGRSLRLTPERVAAFNRIVLNQLPHSADVAPGVIRSDSVIVGNVYRGAPAADCEHLLARLCDWLDQLRQETPPGYEVPVAVVSAILAHLYLAWIHPFNDGNGRTARMIEFQLLVLAGVPPLAAHVLADHYNRTRSEYYRYLALTSQPPYDTTPFIRYALQGFVDGLADQIGTIREYQLHVTWQNFVHDAFRDKVTAARTRQKHLVLDLPLGTFTSPSDIRHLTPRLAEAYAGKQQKAVTRDLNALDRRGLIVRGRTGVTPYIEQIRAFLPPRANSDERRTES